MCTVGPTPSLFVDKIPELINISIITSSVIPSPTESFEAEESDSHPVGSWIFFVTIIIGSSVILFTVINIFLIGIILFIW